MTIDAGCPSCMWKLALPTETKGMNLEAFKYTTIQSCVHSHTFKLTYRHTTITILCKKIIKHSFLEKITWYNQLSGTVNDFGGCKSGFVVWLPAVFRFLAFMALAMQYRHTGY